jgi:heme exporter protein A
MLNVQDLSFSFKNRPLFRGLSFSVTAGTLTRIAGPNGSGKSTLLGLMTGLISGASGSITFADHDDFRSWTSWIAADANGLIPSLSAVANIRFWLELRQPAADLEKIHTVLTNWGLQGDWVQTRLPVSKFSTGMRRRLALARLELEGSKLWLLDEPLFGLDDDACKKFRETLKSHISRGGAAVLVTHDERIVEGMEHQTLMLGDLTK